MSMSEKITINNFALAIKSSPTAKKLKIKGSDYFSLQNKSEYALELTNFRSVRCDVMVYIDGNHVGTWRIDPFGSIVIERPTKIDRKFTFVSDKSDIAHQAGEIGKKENGLIKVIYKPEKQKYKGSFERLDSQFYTKSYDTFGKLSMTNGIGPQSIGLDYFSDEDNEPIELLAARGNPESLTLGSHTSVPMTFSNGLTVLGDASKQKFDVVSKISDYDQSNITEINTRLVVSKPVLSPKYIPLNQHVHSNPVPPRIDELQSYYSTRAFIDIDPPSLYTEPEIKILPPLMPY